MEVADQAHRFSIYKKIYYKSKIVFFFASIRFTDSNAKTLLIVWGKDMLGMGYL